MRNHLAKGWDRNWLIAFICLFLFGLFWAFVGAWTQMSLNDAFADEDAWLDDKTIFWIDEELTVNGWESEFEFAESMTSFGRMFALLSFVGVLIFGYLFCSRYFSYEARCRRIVDWEEELKRQRSLRSSEDVGDE